MISIYSSMAEDAFSGESYHIHRQPGTTAFVCPVIKCDLGSQKSRYSAEHPTTFTSHLDTKHPFVSDRQDIDWSHLTLAPSGDPQKAGRRRKANAKSTPA